MILLKSNKFSCTTQIKLKSPSIKSLSVNSTNSTYIEMCFDTLYSMRDPLRPSYYVISLQLCRV